MKHKSIYIWSALAFVVIIICLLLLRGCTYDHSPKINPDSIIVILYTPMQCEITPWSAWLQNSSIRFIRAPSEQEVINMYYTNEYNITLSGITIINTSEVVCEACNVCKKGYIIETSVKLREIQPMLNTGWESMPRQ